MKKLYDVTVRFDPGMSPVPVRGVALRGEFLFYKSGLTGHTDETGMVDCTEKYPPEQYREDLDSIGGLYYQEMTPDAQGIYEARLRLPAGVYPYHFLINPELDDREEDDKFTFVSNMILPDGSRRCLRDIDDVIKADFKGPANHWLTDPANPPQVPTVTGVQRNSVLYVGTPEDNFRMSPADPAKRGTVTYMSYLDIEDKVRSVAVYLPPRFDRTRTYPLVLVSHGGGGNEGDWPHQGSIGNVMDRLIETGETREAILCCMNNSVYRWDYEKIARNCEERIVPFLESVLPVSGDVRDRAFCGLSMGSMTTLYMYMHRSRNYDYFGAFSGGLAGGPHFTLDDPHLRDVKLMIGTAEEDIAYNQREIGVPPTIRALKAKGLPYTPWFVTGSHDWFCWPEMFRHFAAEILWK